MSEDQALERLSRPIHDSMKLMESAGADRSTINVCLKAMLPLVNHALELERQIAQRGR